MSLCCENVVNLGCVGHCGIGTPFNAEQTGNHTVEFEFLGSLYYFIVSAEAGNPIAFPNVFNENSCVEFSITQPDGTKLSQTAAELAALDPAITTTLTGPFECFRFEIIQRLQLDADPVTASEVVCIMKLTPAKQLFQSVSGDTVTITDFVLADATQLDVYLDGRITDPDETPGPDVINYSISGSDIIFSEDITGSNVLVKVLIEEEWPCL